MGVRFEGTFYSEQTDIEWNIEFWDANYPVGSATRLEFQGQGFEITYHQSSDQRFTPIKASECEIFCIIDNGSEGTALANWINSSLLATQEDLYHVAIYKGLELWWFGVLLSDVDGVREDISKPYMHSIKATDGLKRLNVHDYPTATVQVVPVVRKTFIEIIHECLKNTPFYQYAGENLMFSTVVDWYDNNMPTPAAGIDPLLYSEIDPFTFTTTKEGEPIELMNCYEVLEKVCLHWGMRVIFSAGLFRFIQVNAYEHSALTMWQRFYTTADGAFDGAGAWDGAPITITNDTYPYVRNGGQFTWFPPLRSVYLKQVFTSPNNMIDIGTDMTVVPTLGYQYAKDITDYIIGGTNKRLRLVMSVRIFVSNSYIFSGTITASVAIKIKLGSNYLRKDLLSSLGATWSASTPSVRYEIDFPNLRAGENFINVSIETPDMPSGVHTANEFEFNILNLYDASSGNLTAGTDYTATRVQGTSSLVVNTTSDGSNLSFYPYEARNTTGHLNSEDIYEQDAIFGIYPYASYPGHIFTYDGASWAPSDTTWGLNGPDTLDFSMLRVRENLIGQTKAVAKYQGAFISGLEVYNSILYDSKYWVFNGGTYNPLTETLDGEWFAISTDVDAFYGVGGAENDNGGDTQLRREIGNVDGKLSDTNLKLIYGGPALKTISVDTTGVVGNQIILMTTGLNYTFAAAADWLYGEASCMITLKNITTGADSANIYTIDSALIDGNPTIALAQNEAITCISDGTNLRIIGKVT